MNIAVDGFVFININREVAGMPIFIGDFTTDGTWWYSVFDFEMPSDCRRLEIVARMTAESAQQDNDAQVSLWVGLNHPIVDDLNGGIGSVTDRRFGTTDLLLNPVFDAFRPGQRIFLKMKAGGQYCKNAKYTLTAEATAGEDKRKFSGTFLRNGEFGTCGHLVLQIPEGCSGVKVSAENYQEKAKENNLAGLRLYAAIDRDFNGFMKEDAIETAADHYFDIVTLSVFHDFHLAAGSTIHIASLNESNNCRNGRLALVGEVY